MPRERERRSACSCTWTTVSDMPVKAPVMTHRMATCPQHGDDTEWWERTRKHAESLKYGTTSRDIEAPRHSGSDARVSVPVSDPGDTK